MLADLCCHLRYKFIHYFLLLLLQDGTHTANFCPEIPDEMDIAESTVSDQSDITDSNLLSSSPLTEETFSESEMVINGLIRQAAGNKNHNFM